MLTVDIAANESASWLSATISDTLTDNSPFILRRTPLTGNSKPVESMPGVVLMVVDLPSLPAAIALVDIIHNSASTCSIVAVGYRLPDSAINELFTIGVFDFVSWPATRGELSIRIKRAAGELPVRVTQCDPLPHSRLNGLIGSSPAFMKQVSRLSIIASCNAGVLLSGETGTGKEIFAQAIHYLSVRASRPWVAVNCGAIPTELVENELFGHVKGAYTAANNERLGLVNEAEGGTLFLDDVDCLPLAAQAKLLRFLQEKEYRQVGSNTLRRADVRIIAASNQRMDYLIQQGKFRQDLYFRLNVLSLRLPPLRERREDIVILALHFLRDSAREFGRKVTALSPSAVSRLLSHDWPGNVRELRHVIERAVLLSRGPVLDAGAVEIESEMTSDTPCESFGVAKALVVASFERRYLAGLLSTYCGNVTHAAAAAKKNRRAFFELLRKHEISPQQFREMG